MEAYTLVDNNCPVIPQSPNTLVLLELNNALGPTVGRGLVTTRLLMFTLQNLLERY